MYTITPLDLGSVRREKSFFTYMTDVGSQVELKVVSFLLQSGGQTVLIDTGGPPVASTAPWHLPYEQLPEQTLASQLERHEVDPAEVDVVIFTHLHWDHAYNTEILTSARFFVTWREFEFAKDPCPIQDWMYDAPKTGGAAPFMGIDFEFTDPDREVVAGVRAVPTPGHSPGHQSLAIETAAGTAIVAGDLVPLEENWERQIPNGMLHNLEEHFQSFERLKAVGGHVIASHDPRTLERGPFPSVLSGLG